MSRDFNMFIVEDTESARLLLESAFSKNGCLETFATAEDCLARLNLAGCAPDIFLLDVDLPGMDGYTLCRRIKERPGLENIPVIFISSLDDLESRLDGYDAGGMDYVVKPYNLVELRQKVGAARRLCVERRALNNKAIESELLTSLILSNLDEYAVLIKFLRSLNDCDDLHDLLRSLFGVMRAYRLESAIQLRLPDLEMTVNADGESGPLEVAVINNVRSMDRIFEFKSRAAYNFEHITILVNNVPLADPDLCSRIRDNLAIAAECANAKLQALQTKAENTQAKETAADLLIVLQAAVQDFEKKYTLARYLGSSLTLKLLGELSRAFTALGMSEEQESSIEKIVQTKANDLAEIYDFNGETQKTLNDVAQQLIRILSPATAVFDHGAGFVPIFDEPTGAAVDLF